VPIFSNRLSISVNPGHEEAGHRGDAAQSLPVRRGPFEAFEVGVHDVAVALDGEDQRDVHADALPQRAGNRRQTLFGGRDLDQQVRPVDGLPQVQRLGQGGLGVVRQERANLQRHAAVDPFSGLPDAGEHVAGLLDVRDGYLPDGVLDRRAPGLEVADLGVVGLTLRQRRGEDRRVRRDTGDRVVGDQLLQVPAGQRSRDRSSSQIDTPAADKAASLSLTLMMGSFTRVARQAAVVAARSRRVGGRPTAASPAWEVADLPCGRPE
jgi:hypothetical protein